MHALLQYSDDEDDNTTTDTSTTTTTTTVTVEPAVAASPQDIKVKVEEEEDDDDDDGSYLSSALFSKKEYVPPPKIEEDLFNPSLLRAHNPPPPPIIPDNDEVDIPQNKRQRVEVFSNADMPKGKYVSKKTREDAAAAAAQLQAEARAAAVERRLNESASYMTIPPTLKKMYKKPHKEHNKSAIPQRIIMNFQGESDAKNRGVNCVRWSRPYGQLLASASMDHTVRIWDVFGSQKCAATLLGHTAAVKEIQWNNEGNQVISASYDKTVLLHDVETGISVQTFKHNEFVTALAYHPYQHNLFLSGGTRSGIICWDVRSNNIVQHYRGMFGEVQSLEFFKGGRKFVSSSNITKRNSTDKGIIVWDFETTVVLSNQVYTETYTCPSVRAHPDGKHFLAQSNGNYIAIFNTDNPYKLNKAKRFEGHQVAGYHIGCSVNPSGKIVASGSADGSVYFYDWFTSRILKIVQAHTVVCTDVAYHPLVSSMVASCSWDGRIAVFE